MEIDEFDKIEEFPSRGLLTKYEAHRAWDFQKYISNHDTSVPEILHVRNDPERNFFFDMRMEERTRESERKRSVYDSAERDKKRRKSE